MRKLTGAVGCQLLLYTALAADCIATGAWLARVERIGPARLDICRAPPPGAVPGSALALIGVSL